MERNQERVAHFWKSQEATIESMYMRHDAAEIDHLERSEVLSYLPSLTGLRVLDLASGIGRFTHEFALRASHVTAVDLTPQFLEKNRQMNQGHSNITYICEDARKIAFPGNHFDLVFICGLLAYIEDDELEVLAKQILHWLKIGGWVYFQETCSPHGKTLEGPYSHQRTVYHYHKLFESLFTLVDMGSIRLFIDRYANPLRGYFLYRKNGIESSDKLI